MSADATIAEERPERFRPYLHALARLQIASRPWVASKLDASDLVQQTLLKAHKAHEQFRGHSAEELSAWLRQILTRTLANELRALGQEKRDTRTERSLEAELDASCSRLDAWLAAEKSSPSECAENHERVTLLAAAVSTLPDDQKRAVLSKHCHGLSLDQIAVQMQKTPAAVAGLLRRGLQRLREVLAEKGSA